LSEQVAELIRGDILTGKLLPGDRIRATDAATRYGVSATPLREALRRLAGEGLIEETAQSGARVSAVSIRDLDEIYALRLMLEVDALRQSIRRGDATWARRLQVAADELHQIAAGSDTLEHGISAWSNAHDQFQEALFSACTSEQLIRLVRMLYAQAQRYRVVALVEQDASAHGAWFSEHEEISKAALAKDIPAAVKALRRHLRTTVASVKAGMVALNDREVG
jgi:GntR family transcriptional regulator, carbon starvation induced regulator